MKKLLKEKKRKRERKKTNLLESVWFVIYTCQISITINKHKTLA